MGAGGPDGSVPRKPGIWPCPRGQGRPESQSGSLPEGVSVMSRVSVTVSGVPDVLETEHPVVIGKTKRTVAAHRADKIL